MVEGMNGMNEEKVKAFAARIVEECEQEGFTIEEALRLPQSLRFAVNDRMEKIRSTVKFNVLQADK